MGVGQRRSRCTCRIGDARYAAAMAATQLGLLGHAAPALDTGFAALRRHELSEGAWVDYVPGWISGHERLFDALLQGTQWHTGEELIYDRTVTTPRLHALLPDDGPGHPLLEDVRHVLRARYGEEFVRLSLALYRDGRDSVAFHGDRIARNMPEALVATVSLGTPRRLLLRPRGGGRSRAFNLGWGDLFVMGGSCQRTWQHGIPKVAHAAARMAIMFRPRWIEPLPHT
jgi:alkylated DNA repair dioxygenase AlkB